MNTSKYDPVTSKKMRRITRKPEVKIILDAGRKERASLEKKLGERRELEERFALVVRSAEADISALRGHLQQFIDAGGWHDGLEKLGFKQKGSQPVAADEIDAPAQQVIVQ